VEWQWKGLGKEVEMECNWNGKTLPPVNMEFVTNIAYSGKLITTVAV